MTKHQTSKTYIIYAMISFILGILALFFTPEFFTSMLCDPNPSGISLCPAKGGFAALMLCLALIATSCVFILWPLLTVGKNRRTV